MSRWLEIQIPEDYQPTMTFQQEGSGKVDSVVHSAFRVGFRPMYCFSLILHFYWFKGRALTLCLHDFCSISLSETLAFK